MPFSDVLGYFNLNYCSNLKLKLQKAALNNISNTLKEFYLKVFLQKGCVLVEKNRCYDDMLKGLLRKEEQEY